MKRPTDDFWKALHQLDDELSTFSYYQLLGVHPEASVEDIVIAYERQVRVIHPDMHSREANEKRKQCLTRVYARMGEAHRVLRSAHKRAEYDRHLARGTLRYEPGRAETPRPKMDPEHPQAKSLLKQGLELLAGGDPKLASAKLKLALFYQADSMTIAEAIKKCQAAMPTPVEGAKIQRQHHRGGDGGKDIRVFCGAIRHEVFYVENISEGGMFLRSGVLLDIGSIVEFGLQGEGTETIELPGEIMRHEDPNGDTPGGMGVRFLMIPDAAVAIVRQLLEREGGAPPRTEPVAELAEPLLDLDLPPEQQVLTLDDELDIEPLQKAKPPKPEKAKPPEPKKAKPQEPAKLAKPPEQVEQDPVAEPLLMAKDLVEAGAPGEACKLLQRVIREHPRNTSLRAVFHLAAGLTAKGRGLDDSAANHFERALGYKSESEFVKQLLKEESI